MPAVRVPRGGTGVDLSKAAELLVRTYKGDNEESLGDELIQFSSMFQLQ